MRRGSRVRPPGEWLDADAARRRAVRSCAARASTAPVPPEDEVFRLACDAVAASTVKIRARASQAKKTRFWKEEKAEEEKAEEVRSVFKTDTTSLVVRGAGAA